MAFQLRYKMTLEVYCIPYPVQTGSMRCLREIRSPVCLVMFDEVWLVAQVIGISRPDPHSGVRVRSGHAGKQNTTIVLLRRVAEELVDPSVYQSEITGAVTEGASLLDLHCTGGSDATYCTVSLSPPLTASSQDHYSPTIHTYDWCELAKTTHKPILKGRVLPQVNNPLLWSLVRRGRADIVVTFIFAHDHSCYTHLTVLRTKVGALEAYQEFAGWADKQHGAHQASVSVPIVVVSSLGRNLTNSLK